MDTTKLILVFSAAEWVEAKSTSIADLAKYSEEFITKELYSDILLDILAIETQGKTQTIDYRIRQKYYGKMK